MRPQPRLYGYYSRFDISPYRFGAFHERPAFSLYISASRHIISKIKPRYRLEALKREKACLPSG